MHAFTTVRAAGRWAGCVHVRRYISRQTTRALHHSILAAKPSLRNLAQMPSRKSSSAGRMLSSWSIAAGPPTAFSNCARVGDISNAACVWMARAEALRARDRDQASNAATHIDGISQDPAVVWGQCRFVGLGNALLHARGRRCFQLVQQRRHEVQEPHETLSHAHTSSKLGVVTRIDCRHATRDLSRRGGGGCVQIPHPTSASRAAAPGRLQPAF